MIVEALVRRKTVDLVRIAAEDLVREQFPEVRRVDHGELWTFDLDDESGERDLQRLLDETALVVNPNVHKVTLGDWRKAPAAGARLVVVVKDRVDARAASVLRAARERRGLGGIRGASRATVWSLDVDAENAPAAAERLGLRVAGPEGGLLANPHAQDVQREVVSAS
jgi:phosphoribosylformylglycinamidine (FGAM) synthase PurS component